MTIVDVIRFIRETEGKIFTIKFIKRTTGEERIMTCRTGVKKHLVAVPSKPGLDFKKHDLIPVYDMTKQAYRSIPVEGITYIKIDKEWVEVTGD